MPEPLSRRSFTVIRKFPPVAGDFLMIGAKLVSHELLPQIEKSWEVSGQDGEMGGRSADGDYVGGGLYAAARLE